MEDNTRSVIVKWQGGEVDISPRPRPKHAVRDGSLVITEPHQPNEGPYRRVRSYRSGGAFSPLDEALLGHVPGERVRVLDHSGWYEVEIVEVKQGAPLASASPEAKRNAHVKSDKDYPLNRLATGRGVLTRRPSSNPSFGRDWRSHDGRVLHNHGTR